MNKAIFTSRPLSLKPISWVNSIARYKTQSPVDHVAYLKDGVVYESAAPNGVHSIDFKDWVKGREGTTLISFSLPSDFMDMEVFRKLEGTKYDYKANLLFLFNRADKLKDKATDRQFCSEFFMNMAGYPKPYEYSPDMIMFELAECGYEIEINKI